MFLCFILIMGLSSLQYSFARSSGNPNVGRGRTPKIVRDEIYIWLTILGENNSGRIPTLENLQEWYQDYPAENVPIFADTSNSDYVNTLLQGGWPTIWIFDENLQLVTGPRPDSDGGHYYPLSFIETLGF